MVPVAASGGRKERDRRKEQSSMTADKQSDTAAASLICGNTPQASARRHLLHLLSTVAKFNNAEVTI